MIPTLITMYYKDSYSLIAYSLIAITLFAFGCSRNTDVPKELIGVWRTEAPKYADHPLAFDEHYITFGLGKGREVSHIIKNIEAQKQEGGTAYTFHYETSEGVELPLRFYYEASNGGLIIVNNRDGVWKKIKSGE